jgi:AraC-like DNA-binding protein
MTSATSIRAWATDGILYEDYRYAPGPAEALPRHAHAEYQLTLSFGFPGEYHYRGARHRVPEESLTVLHPGEAHSVHDPRDRDTVATFLMMYVPAPAFERAPFLAEPVIRDPSLLRLATALHAASRDEDELLRHDELRAELLARLAERAGGATDTAAGARDGVVRARRHLEERFAERVRLGELARVAHLSPHYLNRVFRQQVGVPPHRYQLGLRVDRAKTLLAGGATIASAAAAVGFADQAHLTRHFRRHVGLPPGRYRQERSRRTARADVAFLP